MMSDATRISLESFTWAVSPRSVFFEKPEPFHHSQHCPGCFSAMASKGGARKVDVNSNVNANRSATRPQAKSKKRGNYEDVEDQPSEATPSDATHAAPILSEHEAKLAAANQLSMEMARKETMVFKLTSKVEELEQSLHVDADLINQLTGEYDILQQKVQAAVASSLPSWEKAMNELNTLTMRDYKRHDFVASMFKDVQLVLDQPKDWAGTKMYLNEIDQFINALRQVDKNNLSDATVAAIKKYSDPAMAEQAMQVSKFAWAVCLWLDAVYVYGSTVLEKSRKCSQVEEKLKQAKSAHDQKEDRLRLLKKAQISTLKGELQEYSAGQSAPPPGESIVSEAPMSTPVQDNKDGKDGGLTDADFQRALKRGKKAWGRSKIMIVGEGRAGKTALANSIIGKDFQSTDSTIGINHLTCDIKYAAVGGDSWSEYVKPQKELEAALAQMLMNEKMNRQVKEGVLFDALDAQGSEQGCGDVEGAAALPSTARGAKEAVAEASPSIMRSSSAASTHRSAASAAIAEQPSVAAASLPVSAPPTVTSLHVPSPSAATMLNNELIMKCLTDKIHTESKFIVSLFDFGGQSVFNVIHHFFLTKCGVYLLVFNMEWLVTDNAAEKETCLAYLSFWLNSIIIHTQDGNGRTAPVVLVGTRKDKVTDPAQHEAISFLLFNEFKSSIAWRDIVENQSADGHNGKIDLFFFPVDNTAGRSDPTMQKMMKAIEDAIDASDYAHSEQPLSWLQALDAINAKDVPYLAYADIVDVAASCDIPAAMVPKFLRFLHEMGALMWHEEDELKDVVIMNPIAYFVTPATTVICKHAPTAEDHVYHSLEIHKKVKKQHMSDWEDMLNRGIISMVLLEALLESAVPVVEQRTRIVQLMLKYGLLVQLEQSLLSFGDDHAQVAAAGAAQTQLSFLAPALLPYQQSALSASNPNSSADSEPEYWYCGSPETTFYFLFTASKELDRHTTINWQDCQQFGFLPSGLFERLICKAISWSQATSLASDAVQISSLFKDEAILSFGLQRFRVIAMSRQNMIRVEVEGKSPLGVQARLRNLIEKIISECMKSLKFLTILQFRSTKNTVPSGDCKSKMFVRLNQIRQASKGHTALNLMGSSGRSLLSDQEVNALYGAWLTEFQVFDCYDVFISYRWGKHDSKFVQALFDALTLFTVQAERRAVQVFMDSRRLQEGWDFQMEFTNALVHSAVVCPIVSADALLRMQDHQSDEEDNVLLEWIIATACAEQGKVKVVLPIMFGSIDESTGKIGDFFAEKWLNKLPSVKPIKCMKLAADLLAVHGITLSAAMQELTVQDIVRKITKILCIMTWTFKQAASLHLVREVAQNVVMHVEQCLTNGSNSKSADAIAPPAEPMQAQASTVPAAFNSSSDTVPLDSLSVEQICHLLGGMGLEQYANDFRSNAIDGPALRFCDSADDLKEIGISKGIHAKKLLHFVEDWKVSGVSVELLA